MDLLFGDPATRLTCIGFHAIARYNIGGGDDPSHHHMRPDAQMEGFEPAAGARHSVGAATPRNGVCCKRQNDKQRHGVRGRFVFAAILDDPQRLHPRAPASRTRIICGQEMRTRFVDYLATVVKHFHEAGRHRFWRKPGTAQ